MTVGQRIRITATFKDKDGQLGDPDAVTIRVRAPGSASATTVENTRESQGVYTAELVPAISGNWAIKAAGVGTIDTVIAHTVYIGPDEVG